MTLSTEDQEKHSIFLFFFLFFGQNNQCENILFPFFIERYRKQSAFRLYVVLRISSFFLFEKLLLKY